MTRPRLQRCLSCGEHGLSTTCWKCGGEARAAAPMKWSPEDHQGARRRERLGVVDKEWLKSLPPAINRTSTEEE